MSGVIEAGSFLFWVDDINFVQAGDDANGHFIRIGLKSGTELRVDTHSCNGTNELKNKIYNAMIEAHNAKDGE